MTPLARTWVVLGAVAGLLAVAAAAAAAHLPIDPAAARMLASAVQMQGWHAIALVLCAVWSPHANRAVHLAGAAFTLGIILFCGDIYVLALRGVHLGVAPAGGTLLMLGWALLGASAIAARPVTVAKTIPAGAPAGYGPATDAGPAP